MTDKVNTATRFPGCYSAAFKPASPPSAMRHPNSLLRCFCVLLVLGGCTGAPVSPPAAPPTADFHLLMGEVALARGVPVTALEQYLLASARLDDPGISRRAMFIALSAGNESAAHAAADQWEALAPRDMEVVQYQAVLHAHEDDTHAALAYLLQLVDGKGESEAEGDGASGANLQMVTTLLASESNRWRAADLMRAVANARPSHAQGWYGAALLALEADRPGEAERHAELALQRDPNLLDAMFLKARAQLEQQPGGSSQALQPLAGFRHAADPGQRFRYAGLLVMAGRTGEADALYEDILVMDPDQHDARVARALLALSSGRFDIAESELRTLMARHGHIQDALFYMGLLAERRGELHQAADWYARVAPDVPRWLDAQTAIGRLLLELDGPEATELFFAELREMWPQYSLPLSVQQAALLTTAGFPERALPLLDEESMGAAGEHPELRRQMALAAVQAGEPEMAESILRELLEEDPRNPSLQNALGFTLLETGGRLDEAGWLLEAAHAAAPANAGVLDSLGWLRFRQGQLQEARKLLEESWLREPSIINGVHLLITLQALDSAAAADFRAELQGRFPRISRKVE